MNPKKNKTFVSVVVWVMVAGLVGAYAPLIFISPQIAREQDYVPPPQPVPPATSSNPASATSTVPADSAASPAAEIGAEEGFSGPKEEKTSPGGSEKELGN